MSAKIKLLGIGRGEDMRDPQYGQPTLNLAVGESERVRRVPLSEGDLIDLISGAAVQLNRLRADREKRER